MNSTQIKEETYRNLLEDCEQPCKRKYCFYRKYLESQHPSIFIIVQVKLIEKMKYIWETETKTDIGWNNAGLKWTNERFADAYRFVWEEINDPANIDLDYIFSKTLLKQKQIQNSVCERD